VHIILLAGSIKHVQMLFSKLNTITLQSAYFSKIPIDYHIVAFLLLLLYISSALMDMLAAG